MPTAGQLNADASKLVVQGESAGGNLAAVVSQVAKEQGRQGLIKAQVCVCPLLDAADQSRPSYSEFENDLFEDPAVIEVSPALQTASVLLTCSTSNNVQLTEQVKQY